MQIIGTIDEGDHSMEKKQDVEMHLVLLIMKANRSVKCVDAGKLMRNFGSKKRAFRLQSSGDREE